MYKAVNWREIVNIEQINKKIKTPKGVVIETYNVFTVTKEDFYKYGFNTKEWEQSVDIKQWEHDWVKEEYKITYTEKEDGKDM